MNYKYKVGDWRVQFSYAGRHGEEFTVVRNELISKKNFSSRFRLGVSQVERSGLIRPALARTFSCSGRD